MRRVPGVGHIQGGHVKMVCAIDPDTFAQIRALAVKRKTSLAEQIRILIEFGLESET